MNNIRMRFLVCFILLCVLLAGFSAVALAAPSLQWQTEQVYYDSQGRLIIEGYFFNNGSRTITWVNSQAMTVYFRQYNTSWWLQASATFNDLDVTLAPGDSVHWTFRITNVNYAYFDYWNVKWNVNYNYE